MNQILYQKIYPNLLIQMTVIDGKDSNGEMEYNIILLLNGIN